jgi:hypothetical protein
MMVRGVSYIRISATPRWYLAGTRGDDFEGLNVKGRQGSDLIIPHGRLVNKNPPHLLTIRGRRLSSPALHDAIAYPATRRTGSVVSRIP